MSSTDPDAPYTIKTAAKDAVNVLSDWLEEKKLTARQLCDVFADVPMNAVPGKSADDWRMDYAQELLDYYPPPEHWTAEALAYGSEMWGGTLEPEDAACSAWREALDEALDQLLEIEEGPTA